jgi:hypothetical protein
MSTIPFDTLKLARKLEAAGFPAKQAGDTAEALADAMGEEVTTKNNLQLLEQRLKIWFSTAMVAAVGVIVTTIRYFPAGH